MLPPVITAITVLFLNLSEFFKAQAIETTALGSGNISK